jgi:nucleotide-binding universal stress UspA family protein
MGHPFIVVGVDGSEESKAALRFALEEARLREASLRAVHAWSLYPAIEPATLLVADDWDELEQNADAFVERFVSELIGDEPGVDVRAVAVHGTAGRALVEASEGAELLVVGSRGLGGFSGLLLGSVSQQCAHHATCPVVIVRGAPVEDASAEGREHAAAVA